jgi:hypothetical protein
MLELIQKLENLIQTHSLENVLSHLADISEARAAEAHRVHLDNTVARQWARMAVMLDNVREEAHASKTRHIAWQKRPRRDRPHHP